ncbi:hypothetical protein Tco_1480385, partial [Tanacetum coccineum]
ISNNDGASSRRNRRAKKKDTEIPQSSVPSDNVVDEAIYKERDDSLVRAATTASSLEVEQDNGNIAKTQSKAIPNEPSSLGTSSGDGPKRQDTMGDTIAQTRFGWGGCIQIGEEIHDIDADEDITLENVHDIDMFGVNDLDGDKVFVETEEHAVHDATTTSTITVSVAKDLFDVDMTLAQAMA